MNEYPEFSVGGGPGDQSIRQWRSVINQVKLLNRAVFGDNNTQVTASGVRSTARTLPPVLREPDRTVVIVSRPADGDHTLLVREAIYLTLPPKPCSGDGDSAECSYGWYGEAFNVYPPIGMKAVAFAGDENTSSVEVPPKLTTKFHRCHREHDAWVLNAPGGTTSTTSIVLVHASYVSGQMTVPGRDAGATSWGGASPSKFIRVVHMKPSGSSWVSAESQTPIPIVPTPPVGQPQTTPAPGYSVVTCWPGTLENDWQYFQSTGGSQPNYTPLATAVYLTTKMIGGVEYLCPEVFAETGAPDSGTIAGDC